jgi:hypothetical protein
MHQIVSRLSLAVWTRSNKSRWPTGSVAGLPLAPWATPSPATRAWPRVPSARSSPRSRCSPRASAVVATVLASERFLRYDPARNSVDYLAYVRSSSLPGRWRAPLRVGENFAVDFDQSWPAVISQHLIDAYPTLTCTPKPAASPGHGLAPYAEDQNPPPLDHLRSPVALTAN